MIIKDCPACRYYLFQGKELYDCEVNDKFCNECNECYVKKLGKRVDNLRNECNDLQQSYNNLEEEYNDYKIEVEEDLEDYWSIKVLYKQLKEKQVSRTREEIEDKIKEFEQIYSISNDLTSYQLALSKAIDVLKWVLKEG